MDRVSTNGAAWVSFFCLLAGVVGGWIMATGWEARGPGTYDVEHGKCLACGRPFEGWIKEADLGKPLPHNEFRRLWPPSAVQRQHRMTGE